MISLMESLELELGPDSLEPYLSPEESKSIKPVNSFTREVLDYYLVGNHVTGIVIPFGDPKKFRLRNGECTILAGINSAGKSLYAGQIMLGAIEQGFKCLSVSLEMSPPAVLKLLALMASSIAIYGANN